jgi:signal transduction histidine kinase
MHTMQQIEPTPGKTGTERQRVEAVVETLAHLHSQGETLAEVAHDARNMVTALGLYCDLLEEPGVLASPFSHYGSELRLVAAASRRLVEKLVELDHQESLGTEQDTAAGPVLGTGSSMGSGPVSSMVSSLGSGPGSSLDKGTWYPIVKHLASTPRSLPASSRHWDLMPAEPIANLAVELVANRNLLSSLAGPAITLTVETEGGELPVRLTGEDLTRILVNLIKNAAEALTSGGRILIGLRERRDEAGGTVWLMLTVEDNGPGIPEHALENIFASGYTVPAAGASVNTGWPSNHRGLGLAITRSIVEAAGGRVLAANRDQGGACIEIQLPAQT